MRDFGEKEHAIYTSAHWPTAFRYWSHMQDGKVVKTVPSAVPKHDVPRPSVGTMLTYKLVKFSVKFLWLSMIIRASTWWRHQMEICSMLLAICTGNSLVPSEFPAQRPVMQSFDVFSDLRLNKWLSKQLWGWWFETLSCPLCRRGHWKGTIFGIPIINPRQEFLYQ